MKPIILLTNDDGIYSKGINILHEILTESYGKKYDIVVVAPDRDNSGTSHSITLKRPLRSTMIRDDFYAVDGTPTDCINIATRKILKTKPVIIISGINAGANIGHDVFYSGTVAAAREGAIQGIPSVAVSELGCNDTEQTKFFFKPAAHFMVKFLSLFEQNKLFPFKLLSINVPSLPETQINGAKIAKLGNKHYAEDMIERIDPRGVKYYWFAGFPLDLGGNHDSDSAGLKERYITITPIALDQTDHQLFNEIQTYSFA